MKTGLFAAALFFAITNTAIAEDTPRQQAEKVAAEAMAKAQAEKAKNDAIVEKQRAAERAQKKPTPSPTPPHKQ